MPRLFTNSNNNNNNSSSYSNSNTYKQRENSRNVKTNNVIGFVKNKYGHHIRRNDLNKLDRLLEKERYLNDTDMDEIERLFKYRKNTNDTIHSENIKRIRRILNKAEERSKKNNNNRQIVYSENNYNETNNIYSRSNNNLDVQMESLETQASTCLNKSEHECPSNVCLFQDGKCVPNVLNNEKLCFGKTFHDCQSPCKFYGKSVHEKDACHYKYANLDEAKEEHNLIAREIKELQKFIDILQNKNKSIVYYLSYEIKEIDEQLLKLYGTREKILKNKRKSTNSFSSYDSELTQVNEKIFKLKNLKDELKSILSNIKYMEQIKGKPVLKTLRKDRTNNRRGRKTIRKIRRSRVVSRR
jgi:hypothetical protein